MKRGRDLLLEDKRTPEFYREIGRKGGLARAADRDSLLEAARKGGEAVSADREHMAELGRRGSTKGHPRRVAKPPEPAPQEPPEPPRRRRKGQSFTVEEQAYGAHLGGLATPRERLLEMASKGGQAVAKRPGYMAELARKAWKKKETEG